MIKSNDRRKDSIRPDTRIVYRNMYQDLYILTNDTGPDMESYRIILADRSGRIYGENMSFSYMLDHDPHGLAEYEYTEGSFKELNPAYFERNTAVDGLIGQAVGDAFGVPVEFLSRKKVREVNLQDMVGCESGLAFESYWNKTIPAGAWSDDTSMAVAAMSSVTANNGKIDFDDVMKQFLNWWDRGQYTSLEFPFGLGGTVDKAFRRYRSRVPALECGGRDFNDNGNGALMRIFPFAVYCIQHELTEEETLEVIRKAGSLTHGHEISTLGCFIYTLFLDECIRLRSPDTAYFNVVKLKMPYYRSLFYKETMDAYDMLFNKITRTGFDPDAIPETGYVADCLTTAVYCILNTDNYEDAVKTAVGFGYDTDTNAAVTGSIAGALYGLSGIPERWLNVLEKKDELAELAERFSKV